MMTSSKVCCAVIIALVVAGGPAPAQQAKFDLLIRGGHVIDPRNTINSVMDVAIAGGKIVEVSGKIDPARANRVADATGLYVVPGLFDIHTHVFYGTEDTYLSNAHVAVQPDAHGPHAGVTTVVDVGGAGWRNFAQFKTNIIDRSLTRVLSFINVVGSRT
jgi:dihydroorotase